MNDNQKKIINELRKIAKQLGRSPVRRDTPKLALGCYKHFGSFNEAKKKAGLKTSHDRIRDFPKDAFRIDKNLSKIASYLTFDGHLYKDLKGFMFSSKNLNDLKEFERLVKRKFGNLKSIYHLDSGGAGKNKTNKIFFFNKKICIWLFELGVPKGDKVIQKFDVPKWIRKNKEFAREYLKIAYFCEGSFKEESGRTPRIQINLAKSEEILETGLQFMETLKTMLAMFNIRTTKNYIIGKRMRKKDNKISRDIRFRIDIKDNNRFIKEIGWLK